MQHIVFRQCRRDDWRDIMDVCHRTGFMGEDLRGTGRFNDRKLFGLIFCLYYVWYETQNCFVAEDTRSKRVVGYIQGSLDTGKWQKEFFRKMLWRIICRMLFVTIWKYRESFKEVMGWYTRGLLDEDNGAGDSYPAHLHIDILPEYQRMGIGSSLMSMFEQKFSALGVPGVFLETTNHNYKSIPFYEKQGFSLLERKHLPFWREVDDCMKIVFGKKLIPKTKM
ncbi:MAG: GNAT family N-acetyltransferase [Deltaproteobacteria bacterium]|nr:GNAT family N-acetyltransferase [Deltaproteobacteria bacterium]